jgi:hypothetical protein
MAKRVSAQARRRQEEFSRLAARAAREAGGPEPTEEETVQAVKSGRRGSDISHDERSQEARSAKTSDPRRRRRETEERRRAARGIARLAVEAVPEPDALSRELDTTYELRDESGGST